MTALVSTIVVINSGSLALADDADCKNSDFYYETVKEDVEGDVGAGSDKTCYTASALRTVSDDLSKNGASSKYYQKFHASMLADPETIADGSTNYKGTRGYMKMGNKRSDLTGVNSTGSNTDGDTMQFRLIGINHDDKADGSGKTGLTFQAVQIYKYPSTYADSYTSKNSWQYGQGMNGVYCNDAQYGKKDPLTCSGDDANTNTGGWQNSVARYSMNNGIIWSSLPEDFRTNVTPVEKQTNNKGCLYKSQNDTICSEETSANPNSRGNSSTIDKIWLASPSELYGDVKKYNYYDSYSNSQYEYWTKQGMTATNHGKLRMSDTMNCIDNSSDSFCNEYRLIDYLYAGRWGLRSPNST